MNDASRLTALLAQVSGRTLLPLNEAARQSESTAPNFFCVHTLTGAGGGDFVDMAQEIDGKVRFFAIQAPKKLMLECEKLCQQQGLEAMLRFIAQSYAEAIAKLQPEGEINLGGWSAGALVALEIAKALQASGRKVGVLASFDGAPASAKCGASPFWYALKVAWNFPGSLLHRDFGEFKRQIALKLAEWRGRLEPQELQVAGHPAEGTCNWSHYPTYHQHFMMNLYDALEGRTFSAYDGDVVVYRATVQPFRLRGVTEFWRSLAAKTVIVNIYGTHNNLVAKPFVTPLAADLGRRLTQDRQKSSNTETVKATQTIKSTANA